MKAKKALNIFTRGFEETLTAAETKDYVDYIRKGIYLRMWYEQKYGATRAAKIVKDMVDEAKDIETENERSKG